MSSRIQLQDVVGSTVGREMRIWLQQRRGSGESARWLDYAGRGENRGNPGRVRPLNPTDLSKIRS